MPSCSHVLASVLKTVAGGTKAIAVLVITTNETEVEAGLATTLSATPSTTTAALGTAVCMAVVINVSKSATLLCHKCGHSLVVFRRALHVPVGALYNSNA